MIITNLKGGLGNQMFQYALGRTLSLKNGDELKLDTSGLSRANEVGDIYRPFALTAFSIQAPIANDTEVRTLKYPYGFISKILQKVQFKILRQTHVGFEPSILAREGNVYLDGFWQSPKYFETIRGVLLNDFLLTSSSEAFLAVQEKVVATNAVSLHVRRGDYVTNPKAHAVHGICSTAYYQKATEHIQNHVNDPMWFVFSDDITWVKKNLSLPDSAVYVSGSDISDAEELILMSLCKHNVIANSSFSWWGAWLNQNSEKIVVAPTPWFNKNNHVFKDLIPDSWIQLPRN